MKKKLCICIIFIIGFLSLFYYLGFKVKEYRYFEILAHDLQEKTSFNKYSRSIESSMNDKTIIIQAELYESFENLPVEKQFEVLELFCTQLNSFWKYRTKLPLFKENAFHIYGMTESNTYQLNTYPDTYATALSLSVLTINGEIAYTTQQFMKDVDQMDTDNEEHNFAKEVIDYSEYFFNLMTSYGRDFNPIKDVDLVLDAVQKKYGLDMDQFFGLYKKYALKLN